VLTHGTSRRKFYATCAATLALTAASVGVTVLPALAEEEVPLPSTNEAVLGWFDTSVDVAGSFDRDWAVAWRAAANAIDARPTPMAKAAQPIFAQAALATAVHAVLITQYPDDAEVLDEQLEESLGSLPKGRAKWTGRVQGAEAASARLNDRADDGFDPESLATLFPTPEPGPGVWQPTPPEFAEGQNSAVGEAQPFVLPDAADQEIAPPPALDSAEMFADLDEIRDFGARQSTSRTQDQTDVATFWLQRPSTAYQQVVRELIVTNARPIARIVARVATYHEIMTDTQIAVSAAKYRNLRWRPVTALRFDDGDPRTPYLPRWQPTFGQTPATPEYPSGHATFAGSAEVALAALFRLRPASPIEVTDAESGLTRSYTSWSQLTQENVNGRVWAGDHFRGTDVRSADFGRNIAGAALAELGLNAQAE
jgi:hypothetical protein